MCGIFGYLGRKEALAICLNGLHNLEYRGYDSAGVAGIQDKQLIVIKEKGKVSNLEGLLQKKDLHFSLAIAHTRWATHGIPSRANAHPHLDEEGKIAVVHNGVIENYVTIKQDLLSKGVRFSSETDTEVVPHLVALCDQGNFLKACLETFPLLTGSFALALIHRDHPDELIAVAEKSPLVVGYDLQSCELYLASDPTALAGKKLFLYFLENGEVAFLKRGFVPQFFDQQGKSIVKIGSELFLSKEEVSKGVSPHFMLKEIEEQESVCIRALQNRYDSKNKTAFFEELSSLQEELKKASEILLVACGTSFHAAYIISYVLEEKAGIATRVEMASECRYRSTILLPDTLVIALSQSGETADTLACVESLKKRGLKVIALCNVLGSTLAREADATIFLRAGAEIAVGSTKTFTAQLIILHLLALLLARQRGMSPEQGQVFYEELIKIPEKIAKIIKSQDAIRNLALKYMKYHDFYFLGRGVLYPTALEAALKLKEIAYCNAVGYAAGEMKHGPIALLDSTVPVIVFCASQRLEEKMISNLMESQARKAPIIVWGWQTLEKDFAPFCEDRYLIPETTDELACILLAVVGQLFAYYIAREKQLDIDQPRNLAKSVTVE